MNKKTTLLASLGLLVGIAVAPTYGQVWGVPTKHCLRATMLSAVRDEVFVQDSQGKRVVMVSTNAVSGQIAGSTGEVVFECYTDLCFLSQLWTPGQDTGRELLRSRKETEIARRETGKYFALLGAEPHK